MKKSIYLSGHNRLGMKNTEETRRKISEALKGKTVWNKGKTGIYSEETRRKISEACKGRKHTKEAKKKIGNASRERKRLKHTEEAKKKMSEAHKGYKASEETKRKMSEAAKGRKNTKEQNKKISRYVSCAIQEGKFYPGGPGGYGISGEFYSRKSEQYLYYRSLLEKQWYKLLEKMKKVKKYWIEPCVIPYKFKGIIRNYLPDLRIVYIDGTSELVEIKPEGDHYRNNPKNIAKWKAATKWCRTRKRPIRFKVVGYDDLK